MPLTVTAVILARLGSHRLPGKPLLRVGGKPLVEYVYERACLAGGLDNVVIATSIQPEDDEVARYASQIGVECFRGSSENVAERLLLAASASSASHVVRINSDSPFLQPELITQAVRKAKDGQYDLVTNIFPRSYPYGIAAEVLKVSTLAKTLSYFNRIDREHVTRYFYRNPEKFSIRNLTADAKHDVSLRLVIDTQEDLKIFTSLVRKHSSDLRALKLQEIEEFYKSRLGE